MEGQLTRDDLGLLGALYLDRLQTAFLYGYGSVMVRGYSEDLARRLAEFSRQDTNQALCLHGLSCDPRALSHDDPVQTSLMLVKGVISKKGPAPQDDNAKELFISLSIALLETFAGFEGAVAGRLRDIPGSGALMEASLDHLNLAQLRFAVDERIANLEGLRDMVRTGELFDRGRETGPWRCLNCGYPCDAAIAPEECPCCKAQQKYIARGTADPAP
jgi:predicted Zn-ribbon and HTH transcriptional regulator